MGYTSMRVIELPDLPALRAVRTLRLEAQNGWRFVKCWQQDDGWYGQFEVPVPDPQ